MDADKRKREAQELALDFAWEMEKIRVALGKAGELVGQFAILTDDPTVEERARRTWFADVKAALYTMDDMLGEMNFEKEEK